MRRTSRAAQAVHGALLVAATCLGSCGPAAVFTPRGEARAARPAGCAIGVIHRRPARDYAVIGALDLAAFSVRRLPRDDAEFVQVVRHAVCEAGGDAVIPGVTGDGRYVLGAVVKWMDDDAGLASEPRCTRADEAPRAALEEPGPW